MKLLHLTYDYPDIINSKKTEAIKNIVNIYNDLEYNYCVSLNRTINFKNLIMHNNCNITALNTFGLPKGVFFSYTLKKSIKRVLDIGLDMKTFDKIHAHKLTFEGPIAYYLYGRYSIPYLITIQQTDFKVLKYKPLMTSFYYRILKESERIIIISPWMEKRLYRTFGSNRMEVIKNKVCKIPLIVDRNYIIKKDNNGKMLCVFHMKNDYVRIKNIFRVLKAISQLKKLGAIIELDIAGDGPAKDRIEKMIKKLKIEAQVRMIGKIENNKIIEFMSNYKAFILCSYPETFGMVYIEALSAGIPVIYSMNAGIDGFFDDKGIGIAVRHNRIREICNALVEMDSNQKVFKENVQKLQESGYLNMFSRKSVEQKYKIVIGMNDLSQNT